MAATSTIGHMSFGRTCRNRSTQSIPDVFMGPWTVDRSQAAGTPISKYRQPRAGCMVPSLEKNSNVLGGRSLRKSTGLARLVCDGSAPVPRKWGG